MALRIATISIFEITGANVVVQNVTVKNFGDTAPTNGGIAVFKVPITEAIAVMKAVLLPAARLRLSTASRSKAQRTARSRLLLPRLLREPRSL